MTNPTDRDGLVLHARLDALAAAVDQHGLNGKRFREHVTATIRQAAAALREDARDAERIKRDIGELYEVIPMLPITKETMESATDWFTRYCIDFHREINAMQTPSGDGGGG